MAVKPRLVFSAVLIEYVGQPKVSFFVDGAEKLSEVTLPEQTIRLTRRFSLPPGCTGYNGHLFINPEFRDIVDYNIESSPEESFRNNILYHYYDVTLTGNITLQLYLDETAFYPNNRHNTTLSVSPRDSKSQDTRKIFFSPLAYGYVPHIRQTIDATETGQIISANAVALPPTYTKGLRTHSEFQVTYQGECHLEIFMDGAKIHKGWLPEQKIDQDGGYVTHKDYLPAGTDGHVLQWIQSDGDGDIAVFETDMTLADKEQPNITNPN